MPANCSALDYSGPFDPETLPPGAQFTR